MLMNGCACVRASPHPKCLLITGLLSDGCLELAVGEVLQRQCGGANSLQRGTGGTCRSGSRRVQLYSQWDTQPDSFCQVHVLSCLFKGFKNTAN